MKRLFLCLALAGQLPAQEFQTHFDIFWPENLLVITIEVPLLPGQVLPVRRLQTETLVRQNLPDIAFRAVSSIAVDYRGTIFEYSGKQPWLYGYFTGLSEIMVQDFSRTNADFTGLTLRYSLPLTRISEPFVKHDRPHPVAPSLARMDASPFTGLVIYARGNLPVHGESAPSRLRPSLFPRLMDENTDVLFERETLAPDLLKRQSAVVYSQSLAEPPFRGRIGSRPLRIAAKGLFGTSRTDLILLQRDALILRGTEDGRRVLAEGRILIIVDEE